MPIFTTTNQLKRLQADFDDYKPIKTIKTITSRLRLQADFNKCKSIKTTKTATATKMTKVGIHDNNNNFYKLRNASLLRLAFKKKIVF